MQFLVENLHARYAQALDADRLEDWPDFFTEKGVYRITTAENEARGLPLPVLYCEGRPMLRDRVASLRHANIYEPQRYRHIVSSLLIEKASSKTVKAMSSFLVVRTMENGESTLFASGRYLDLIQVSKRPLFIERVVVCDSRRFDTLLAIPL
jgi:3-phenylpropionate/cinnamic acid dioxygenase small subunit